MEQSKKNITNVDTLARERERNLAKENGETQQTNITEKNMKDLDDLKPSEKYVVQREDISNAPTEKCLENVGFEFEKYVDVGSWPISLNNTLLDNTDLNRQHALYYSDTPPLRLPAYLRMCYRTSPYLIS
ncbi:uncharacterized protein TNCV_2498451 [Trichonephila clavipes]|nr:uncharacterized protein TNCV_2498451 [Trichonephila clavipes]